MKITCPKCSAHRVMKNGIIYSGKQNYKCIDCSRQFISPSEREISPKLKKIINRLLHENVSVAKIARATGTSKSYLYKLRNKRG